jgi:hypothetical protein
LPIFNLTGIIIRKILKEGNRINFPRFSIREERKKKKMEIKLSGSDVNRTKLINENAGREV